MKPRNGVAIQIGMDNKIRAVHAKTFERLFTLRSATRVGTDGEELPAWWAIARRAIKNGELGPGLQQTISSLSEEQRGALFLCDGRGLNCEDAAWILNVPVQSVDRWLSEARTQLCMTLAGMASAEKGNRKSVVTANAA
jgi:DNA-directed RNA polymerase specialized sigma24 family protein